MGYIVKVEFGGIQRFIFEVPRLAVMRGANALLGDVIRKDLVVLAVEAGCIGPKENISITSICEFDPISKDDNPVEMWEQGILSRDGGHFYAYFSDQEKANCFVSKAHQLISEKLPDITFTHSILNSDETLKKDKGQTKNHCEFAAPHRLPSLSVFQPCELNHIDIAQAQISKSREAEGKYWVAQSVYDKNKVGRAKSEDTSHDTASLLLKSIDLSGVVKEKAGELNHLAGEDYLALIVVDGNNMGNRANELKNKSLSGHPTEIQQQAFYESFFYTARCVMRAAVKQAITATFDISFKKQPFEILMLGGDDLMFACQAKYALPFVESLTQHLLNKKWLLADDQPMSVACGVAMAKASLPFHRLHHVAEELLSSAKVKWRGLPKEQQQYSTVDWEVITQAWVDDPMTARLQSHVHQFKQTNGIQTLLTTGKPYLCQSDQEENISLAAMLKASDSLKKAFGDEESTDSTLSAEIKPARSQLRHVLEVLPQGKLAAQNAWLKVPLSTRQAVLEALPSFNSESFPWQPVMPQQSPQDCYLSHYGDLVEVFELWNKKRNMEREKMGLSDQGSHKGAA